MKAAEILRGMRGWLGLHARRYVVPSTGRRGVEKKKHAQWRWGHKRRLRRARRRLAKVLIAREQEA